MEILTHSWRLRSSLGSDAPKLEKIMQHFELDKQYRRQLGALVHAMNVQDSEKQQSASSLLQEQADILQQSFVEPPSKRRCVRES